MELVIPLSEVVPPEQDFSQIDEIDPQKTPETNVLRNSIVAKGKKQTFLRALRSSRA